MQQVMSSELSGATSQRSSVSEDLFQYELMCKHSISRAAVAFVMPGPDLTQL